MRTTLGRELCTVYVIVIVYSIIIVQCDISNDDGPDPVSDVENSLARMQSMEAIEEGSGPTNDTSTDPTIRTTISTSTVHSKTCNPSEILWSNNTCIPKVEAQKLLVNTLRNNSSNSSVKADALLNFFNLNTSLVLPSNTSDSLTPREIDELIDGLNNITIINSSTLFIMALPTIDGNDTILGGGFRNGMNHVIVKKGTRSDTINSELSAAIIINDRSINDIDVIRVGILGEPTAYENLDRSNNQSVVSSIIIASVQKKQNRSLIEISLYFQVVKNQDLHYNGRYSCSFFDTNTSKWNESGCTTPQYNKQYNRYECTCNHLTTFALIWLPKTPLLNYLTPQDIASLIFLSISILCFIAVIIHSLTSRFLNPIMSLTARDLLPLISSATTTILFIFYIALSMTIYTRISSIPSNPTACFTSASILMFITYFLLIFMFCIKTSVGYFNYLRFVHLFPEPSNRKLFVMIIISFFISITWTAFAAGFNSNSSYNITQIYGNKLCWFTRDVIYYFMTIPVCVFLLLNFITIIFVAKRIISHIQRATSSHQSYGRMKRCVLVLLSSCVTQGIGWLFGPFISFVNPTAGDVLGWFFIIFNGLEGVWTILLYIIIRSQHLEESKRVMNSNSSTKKTSSTSVDNEK